MAGVFGADNLRVFLEVARTGRLADAARRLAMDQTTVSRRISRLEKDAGGRLFDRGPAGWRLTETGRRLVPYAESIETTLAAAFDAAAPAAGAAVTGTVRVLSPDGFGSFVLVPGLAGLRAAHPGLVVEVLTATTHDLLTGRDFDVAVTLERPSPRSVLVRRLAEYDLRLYASRGYLAGHPPIRSRADLPAHTLIWYVDALLDVEPLRILDTLLPECRAQIQTNNIAGHYQAVRHGLGIAPLPGYLGAADPDLVPVLPDEVAVRRGYWLVVPRELARLQRVRAVTEALSALVEADPELFVPE